MSCAICFEDMDMRDFKDPRQSTTTCYKLGCEHAYHTSCIIRSLTMSRHECPLCNKIKPPEIVLNNEGYARKLLSEIARIPEVVTLRRELITSQQLLIEKKTQLKKDIQKYAEQRAKEIKYLEHRKYFVECLNKVKGLVRMYCNQLGNKYIGAFFFKANRYGISMIDSMLLRQRRSWIVRQLKGMRLYIPVNISNKHNGDKDVIADNNGDDDLSLHIML